VRTGEEFVALLERVVDELYDLFIDAALEALATR
jgi:hypothetical protein